MLVALALAARMLYNAVVLGDYTPTSDADHYSEIATNVAAGIDMSKEIPVTAGSRLGRVGVADDIGRVALFCASDMAMFMTGSTLLVDAGETI